MPIVVQLIGGLGNQMFQYALGRTLALRNGSPLKLDIQPFEKQELRRYSLHRFAILASVLSAEESIQLGIGSGLLGRIGRLVNRMRGVQSLPLVRERSFTFDPSVLERRGRCYLQGYWQSPRYFASMEPTIRGELTVREPPAGANLAMAEKIKSTLAVSVHVRRGDYASSRSTHHYHGTCGPDYYLAAEADVRRRVGNCTLFVFSDDPNWVTQNLRFESETIVVRHNGPEGDYEDLRLMTLCQHHIIANSTFSWWGAWLCPNPGKFVVAPRQWFRDPGHSADDLIPREWIRL